jgi:hypothetical protein
MFITISPKFAPRTGRYYLGPGKRTVMPLTTATRDRFNAPLPGAAIRVSLMRCLVALRAHRLTSRAGGAMYVIVYKSDGFPICRQVAGVSPDPVVTWNTEAAARAFIQSKGADADFQPVQITDEAMDKMAKVMGCPVESMTFEPYPG